MKKFTPLIVLALALAVGIFTYQKPPEKNESLGATKPAALFTYRLSGAGISSSATSLSLNSLTLPQNDYAIQDSDLSSTFYMTLEPGSTDRQEIVSCTTVGTNTGSTVAISGCTRGLSPIYPYTASTTLQFAHSGGAAVVFSDPPQLLNEYPAKANTEIITGDWRFAVAPSSTDECALGTEFCTKTYIDNVDAGNLSAGNVADNYGLFVVGSSPIVSIGVAANPTSGLATSTALGLYVDYGYGLTIGADNQLKVATSTDNFSWGGVHQFNAAVSASTTLQVTGTTQLYGSLCVGSGTSGMSCTSSITAVATSSVSTVTIPGVAGKYNTTTYATTTIPAGTMTKGNVIRVIVSGTYTGAQGFGNSTIALNNKEINYCNYALGDFYSTTYITFGEEGKVNFVGSCQIRDGDALTAQMQMWNYTTSTLNFTSEQKYLELKGETYGTDSQTIDAYSITKY